MVNFFIVLGCFGLIFFLIGFAKSIISGEWHEDNGWTIIGALFMLPGLLFAVYYHLLIALGTSFGGGW